MFAGFVADVKRNNNLAIRIPTINLTALGEIVVEWDGTVSQGMDD